MSLPEALDPRHVDELAHHDQVAAVPGGPTLAQRLLRRIPPAPKAAAKRVLRQAVRLGGGDEARATAQTALALGRRVGDEVAALRPLSVDADLARHDSEINRINLELLKGEVRAVERRLEELGMAFAPATGLAGAGARFAELREQVVSLERRFRPVVASPGGPPPVETQVAPGRLTGPPVRSALFNYVAFERRFRGDPAKVSATLAERYADLLAAHPPVIDLGCGRAELVELLAARGVSARGVDTDPSMVADCRARGLDVVEADALSFLTDSAEGSLGSLIATHVVEHLELDALIELLDLAASRLRPGGVLVAETPNPASLIVLGNSYILDPTHVRPLHPSLLVFLCENAGFRDVRLRFFAPAEDYHLPLVDAPDAPAWVDQINHAFSRLNETLFGPQEYAVVATTPPSAG